MFDKIKHSGRQNVTAAGYNKHFGEENHPQQTVSAHCDRSKGKSLLAGTDQGPVMCTRGGSRPPGSRNVR